MTIQSVKITNLYGNNYEWQLNPNVNILIGANGTYKSTILNLIRLKLIDSSLIIDSSLNRIREAYNSPNLEIQLTQTKKVSSVRPTFVEVTELIQNNKCLDLIKFIISNYTNYLTSSEGQKRLIEILNAASYKSENKNLVLFLDNPENNLHIDWQRNLIKWIKELNPTCQIIMTTHSPTIWYQGWIDSITHIEDIKIN